MYTALYFLVIRSTTNRAQLSIYWNPCSTCTLNSSKPTNGLCSIQADLLEEAFIVYDNEDREIYIGQVRHENNGFVLQEKLPH